MTRKVTIAEYNRLVQQHNQKVKQARDRYNNEVKRQIDSYNREVQKVNSANKNAVDNYNRQVRTYNSNQSQRRANLERALRQLNSTPYTTRVIHTTTEITKSTQVLTTSYDVFNRSLSEPNNYRSENEILTYWPEKETTNSVELCNSLNGYYTQDISSDFLNISEIETSLSKLSSDLGKRWKGALFSLNHNNPDASRHFCASVREILIKVLDIKAPDDRVSSELLECEYYDGKPNRRSKIKYILKGNSISFLSFENFINVDVQDIINLFEVLNSGTHGISGKLNIQQLIQLKKRVEDSIQFILKL